MSISSIVQIASRLLSGDSGQDSQGQSKNKVAASQAQNNRTEFGDRFTPSAQGEATGAAGGTGFFQAEQLRFTAINIQTPAGGAAATTTPAPAPGPTTAPPVTAVDQAAAPNAVAATTAAATPATTTTSPIQTQQDLQALNASLSALGLNAAEIAAFDQFAGVLLQFDPNALQDLENQLNLLAARFQTQNSVPAPTPQTSAATPQTAGATAQTSAASPSFTLTELSISFSGLNGTLTRKNQGKGNGTTAQFSAFNLQIQEVRVTLSNPAGETAQLQVPQANTPNGATVTSTAKSASA